MVSSTFARRVAALAAAITLAATGCTTPPPVIPSEPAASSTRSAPSDAVSLAELGFSHGPAELWLPRSITITQRVDLATNVTLVVISPSGPELAQWLREILPAAGFTITADGQDSLLFERDHWQGAFTTTDDDLSALSLRSDRE